MRKKRHLCQQCHLALLGPTSVKAARKTLVELTPDLATPKLTLTLKVIERGNGAAIFEQSVRIFDTLS
jgi:hypothetical protein